MSETNSTEYNPPCWSKGSGDGKCHLIFSAEGIWTHSFCLQRVLGVAKTIQSILFNNSVEVILETTG